MLSYVLVASILGQIGSPTAGVRQPYMRRGGDTMAGAFGCRAATIAADDTTPDVSVGCAFVTSANTGATAITAFDNERVGQLITICGGSSVNATTISDAGNFNLNGALTLNADVCALLYVQAGNDYVEITRSNITSSWIGTATSNLDMSTFVISFGTDPADQGDIRLENNTSICWEADPASADEVCLKGTASSSRVLEINSNGIGRISIGPEANTADAGAIRFAVGDQIGWEASPAGNDCFLTSSTAENMTFSCPVAFASGAAQSMTLNGATTFGITASTVLFDCTGAETLNTITGGSAGVILYLQNADSECTIADDDTATAANAINLLGTATNDVGATGKWLTLIHDGNAWQQVAESANN